MNAKRLNELPLLESNQEPSDPESAQAPTGGRPSLSGRLLEPSRGRPGWRLGSTIGSTTGGLLWVLSVLALTACQRPTGVTRDPRCLEVGDTIGVVRKGAGGIVSECVWLVAEARVCFDEPVRRVPSCVVGGPMVPAQRGTDA